MSDIERLRALLAEARAAVGDYECIDCGIGSQDLWGRIDEELARPEIEWVPDTFWGDDAVKARVGDMHLEVNQHEFDGPVWRWSIWRGEHSNLGVENTKEEAQAAAIKALKETQR